MTYFTLDDRQIYSARAFIGPHPQTHYQLAPCQPRAVNMIVLLCICVIVGANRLLILVSFFADVIQRANGAKFTTTSLRKSTSDTTSRGPTRVRRQTKR